ncbi:hypothetical protein [Zooshikella ganghwensis]|uniref:hypothetical protein n=1 Tax=Zooshikella ganghwensis TaxID=202772 RepID=UPI00047F18C1|nr:hypothetical protein [Zooshikella ganghwensis]
MEIDPNIADKLNAIWLTPYGISAKYIFIGGILFMLVLLVKRHKMSVADAALALAGFKPVLNRDIWFNLLHAFVIVAPLALLVISIQLG